MDETSSNITSFSPRKPVFTIEIKILTFCLNVTDEESKVTIFLGFENDGVFLEVGC